MKTCQTCRWWRLVQGDDESYRIRNLVVGNHPTTHEVFSESQAVQLHGYRVRQCLAPKLLFYQRPSRNGLAMLDGSGYFAALVTGEDFGCVLHEDPPLA